MKMPKFGSRNGTLHDYTEEKDLQLHDKMFNDADRNLWNNKDDHVIETEKVNKSISFIDRKNQCLHQLYNFIQ